MWLDFFIMTDCIAEAAIAWEENIAWCEHLKYMPSAFIHCTSLNFHWMYEVSSPIQLLIIARRNLIILCTTRKSKPSVNLFWERIFQDELFNIKPFGHHSSLFLYACEERKMMVSEMFGDWYIMNACTINIYMSWWLVYCFAGESGRKGFVKLKLFDLITCSSPAV